ncbi:hypothetical protein ACFVWN_01200 [Nocardiopsis flavescens]|uniref:hypothetical protein n=1 Tax=Nocardiopsis flavescens TaxID=758803 RepID=UPI003652C605
MVPGTFDSAPLARPPPDPRGVPMRRSPLAATVLAALLATACTGETPAPDEPVATESQDAAADPGASAEETAAEPVVLGLDETHTYDDGFAISLSGFERFNGADYGFDDQDWVSFTVTFANGTDAPVEIDRVERSCVVGGVEGDYEAFDHLAYDWPSLVQSGDEGIWQPACAMPVDEEELQFSIGVYAPEDVEPSYEVVHFSGQV